jgi:DNA helicase-2/ATP-dependent DNA helicase PcrA
MYLGTFHSICLRILEDFREFTRLKRSFTLFDQFDQQYFLYQRIKDFRELPDAQLVMGDDQSGRWAQSENLLKWLNKVSEEALDAATLAAAPEVEIRALATCFAKYQELLHEHNSLDFSGIQYEALQLLEKRPEVLAQLREKLTYLMVDEYQDTNTIQERILLLLAGERAICASWVTTTKACTAFAGPPSATSWSSPRCSMRASASRSSSPSTTARTRTSSASTTSG